MAEKDRSIKKSSSSRPRKSTNFKVLDELSPNSTQPKASKKRSNSNSNKNIKKVCINEAFVNANRRLHSAAVNCAAVAAETANVDNSICKEAILSGETSFVPCYEMTVNEVVPSQVDTTLLVQEKQVFKIRLRL